MSKTKLFMVAAVEEDYKFYLSAKLDKYVGQWIAIIDKKIVSHGNDFKKVYEEAKKEYPAKQPLFACVPKATAMIL